MSSPVSLMVTIDRSIASAISPDGCHQPQHPLQLHLNQNHSQKISDRLASNFNSAVHSPTSLSNLSGDNLFFVDNLDSCCASSSVSVNTSLEDGFLTRTLSNSKPKYSQPNSDSNHPEVHFQLSLDADKLSSEQDFFKENIENEEEMEPPDQDNSITSRDFNSSIGAFDSVEKVRISSAINLSSVSTRLKASKLGRIISGKSRTWCSNNKLNSSFLQQHQLQQQHSQQINHKANFDSLDTFFNHIHKKVNSKTNLKDVSGKKRLTKSVSSSSGNCSMSSAQLGAILHVPSSSSSSFSSSSGLCYRFETTHEFRRSQVDAERIKACAAFTDRIIQPEMLRQYSESMVARSFSSSVKDSDNKLDAFTSANFQDRSQKNQNEEEKENQIKYQSDYFNNTFSDPLVLETSFSNLLIEDLQQQKSPTLDTDSQIFDYRLQSGEDRDELPLQEAPTGESVAEIDTNTNQC